MNLSIKDQQKKQLSLKDVFDAMIDSANEFICSVSGAFSGYNLEKISTTCDRFQIL